MIIANLQGQAANRSEVPFLLFDLAKQLYGLPIAPIVQIIEMVTIHPLPQAPSFVKGIINYRGQIVPVIDLRLRFGLPEKPYQLHTPIILLDFEDQLLGMVVDTAHEVHFIAPTHISKGDTLVPLKLTHIDDPSAPQQMQINRVAQAEQQLILILDIESLLTETEQISLLHAMAIEQA